MKKPLQCFESSLGSRNVFIRLDVVSGFRGGRDWKSDSPSWDGSGPWLENLFITMEHRLCAMLSLVQPADHLCNQVLISGSALGEPTEKPGYSKDHSSGHLKGNSNGANKGNRKYSLQGTGRVLLSQCLAPSDDSVRVCRMNNAWGALTLHSPAVVDFPFLT